MASGFGGEIQNWPGPSPSARPQSVSRWLGTQTRPKSTGRYFLRELFLLYVAVIYALLFPLYGNYSEECHLTIGPRLSVSQQKAHVQTLHNQHEAFTPALNRKQSSPPF